MTKLAIALLTFASLSAPGARADTGKQELPRGLRCESVKQSSVLDLPAFCRNALDKRRLVDYGYQLDSLEVCGEAALAKSIKAALQSKVFRDDVRGCAEAAENLARNLNEQR
jgi:hypothetical protein